MELFDKAQLKRSKFSPSFLLHTVHCSAYSHVSLYICMYVCVYLRMCELAYFGGLDF